MRTFHASLLAASALTSVFVSPALAQDISATGETTSTADQPAAERQAAAGSEEEIFVTARRREEALTDVPISISVVTPDGLDTRGIERVDDLTRAVPSLKTNATAGRRSNSQYEIRGINVVESLVTADPPVGLYINDVFRARATGTNQSFFDIENVQVLYGPQGTLFGRSATAGAVLINTRAPSRDFEGSIEVGIGNLDRRELTAILNLPVNDVMAIRFAGQRVRQDGFQTNITNGRLLGSIDSWSGRVSVLLEPSNTLRNITVASYYDADETGSAIFLRDIRPCPPAGVTPRPVLTCNLAAAVNAAFAQQQALGTDAVALDPTLFDWAGINRRTVPANAGRNPHPYERPRNVSVTNTTTFDLNDQMTVKNIFGFNHSRYLASTDLDATSLKFLDVWYDQQVQTISNELQLQGEMTNFNWVVGGIYFHERGRDIQNSVQVIQNYSHQNLLAINESYALFAQGTYRFTPELSLTAGARYSWDNRTAVYDGSYTQTGIANPVPGVPFCTLSSVRDAETGALLDPDGDCFIRLEESFTEPTYTVSVEYKPSRELLFYAASRRGYRSGGFQSRVVPNIQLLPYDPETVIDVEVGFKGDFILGEDSRLLTSIALYKSWWDDLQRSTTVPVPNPPFTTTATANAATATVQGFEATVTFTPVRWLTLDAYLGYVDGVYGEFSTAVATLQDIPFPTSKWTGGATVSVTAVDTPEIGRVRFVGDLSFRSEYFGDQELPLISPETRVPPQQFVNLSAQWENILGSDFTLQAWVRNLTDETRIVGQTAIVAALGILPAVLGEPRTYGMSLRYEF